MDPLTVLLSALSLAGTALKPIADQVIKTGYVGLKELIIRKFGSKEPELAQVLDQNEKRPDVYKPAAEATLKQVGATRIRRSWTRPRSCSSGLRRPSQGSLAASWGRSTPRVGGWLWRARSTAASAWGMRSTGHLALEPMKASWTSPDGLGGVAQPSRRSGDYDANCRLGQL